MTVFASSAELVPMLTKTVIENAYQVMAILMMGIVQAVDCLEKMCIRDRYYHIHQVKAIQFQGLHQGCVRLDLFYINLKFFGQGGSDLFDDFFVEMCIRDRG